MYKNYRWAYASCLTVFSGYYSYSAGAGAFYLSVTTPATYSGDALGGRLMFL